MQKEIFFIPQNPKQPTMGMGWIEIDNYVVKQLSITHLYRYISYGNISKIIGPDGLQFSAYLDNPYGFGGRQKKCFIVHTHEEVVPLLVQKKLNIDAVLHFVRTWAKPDARVITPGKRVINLSVEYAELPGYVYFIFNLDSNAIKVGFTQDVRKRLAALQTSSPAQLELLGAIKTQSATTAKQLEKDLHQQFAQWHLSGEWFKAEKTLLNYIAEVMLHNKID